MLNHPAAMLEPDSTSTGRTSATHPAPSNLPLSDPERYAQAEALFDAGDQNASMSMLLELVEHDTPMWEPYNDLGVMAQTAGDYPVARHFLTQATNREPVPGTATRNLSELQLQLGDTRGAAEVWGRALAHHAPSDVLPCMSDFLRRIADDPTLLSPLIERLRTELYSSGNTRAASGQAHPPTTVLRPIARLSELPDSVEVLPATTPSGRGAHFHFETTEQVACPAFPPVCHYSVGPIYLHPRSETFEWNNHVVLADSVNLAEHLLYDSLLGRCVPLPAQTLCYVRPDRVRDHLRKGVLLHGFGAINWSHFLTEILPVAALVEKSGIDENFPLVVSKGMHANMLAMLDCVKSPGRRVVTIEGYTCVEEAIVFSPVATVPYDYVRSFTSEPPTFAGRVCMFSAHALQALRERLPAPPPAPIRRLYIHRKSAVRHIRNSEEVCAFFAAEGFEVVEPERLDARAQQALFSSACIIVGQAGAGIANMVFASSGTRIVVLAADSPYSSFDYFTNMAIALGHELHYFGFPPIVGSNSHPGHADMHVDLKVLRQNIELFASTPAN